MAIRIEVLNSNTDDIPYQELTEVLNIAYSDWKKEQLEYKAVNQTEEDTRNRIKGGWCMIAYVEEKIVGTMTLHVVEKVKRKWYEDKKYITLTQLAVLQEYRDSGVLLRMMFYLKNSIIKKDKSIESLIGDTSTEAHELLSTYLKVGAQVVDVISWHGTNYYSYILRYPFTGQCYSDKYCRYKVKLAKLRCYGMYKKTGELRTIFRVGKKIIRI